MNSTTTTSANNTAMTMAELADHITAHAERALPLAELADLVGVSPSHLQRRFKAELGVSPRQYQQQIRLRRLQAAWQRGDDISGAIYEAGFGSLSRVYEHADTLLGMTPARYGRGGHGEQIHYLTVATRLGWLIMAATARGICHVHFGDDAAALRHTLRQTFPRAELLPSAAAADPRLQDWMSALQQHLDDGRPRPDLPLHVFGTALQIRTWRFLTSVRDDVICDYSTLATGIGRSTAVRAVANACAANNIAVLIPCHRVLRKDGSPGGYRWGLARKQALLGKAQSMPNATGNSKHD